MTNSGNSRQNLLTQAMGASLALLSVLMAAGAAFSAERAAKPCWTDTTIVLEGALPTTNPGLKPDLELYLQTAEGKWNKDVLGYSMFHKAGERIGGLSWMDHEGTITVTKQDGDKTQLDVDMAIHDDPWCKGGAGKYKIEIQRGPSGAVSGSFEGVFDRKGGIAGPAGSFPCKGEDYVANCEAAQWLLAKWVFEWVRINGRPQCVPQGMYGQQNYEKGMLSDGGDFSMGFGVCPKAYLPGAKWCANYLFQREGDGPGWYDCTLYPHRAVCAFVNWPIDVKEASPAEAMGHILYDREADFWVLRSGWGDKDITFVGRGAALTRLTADPEAGTAGGFRPPPGGPTTFHQFDTNATVLAMQWERPDGAKGQSCVAVDVSGLSGARMLLASIADMNPAAPAVEVKPDAAADAKGKDEAKGKAEFLRAMGGQKGKADGGGEASATTLQVGKAAKIVFGGREVTVVGMGAGWQAEYKVVGTGQDARILIGKRAISCDGKKLVLGLAEAN